MSLPESTISWGYFVIITKNTKVIMSVFWCDWFNIYIIVTRRYGLLHSLTSGLQVPEKVSPKVKMKRKWLMANWMWLVRRKLVEVVKGGFNWCHCTPYAFRFLNKDHSWCKIDIPNARRDLKGSLKEVDGARTELIWVSVCLYVFQSTPMTLTISWFKGHL